MRAIGPFTLSLLFAEPIADWSEGKLLLEFLTREAPELSPEYIQNHEPIKTPFISIEATSSFWHQPLLWKRKKEIKCEGSIWMGDADIHTAVYINNKYIQIPLSTVSSLLTKAPPFLRLEFAYAHVTVYRESEVFPYEIWHPLLIGLTTHDLRKGIPLLPWATVFGAPYVNLLGMDTFLDVPAHTVTLLNDQQVYIQITELIEDIYTDYDGFARKRAQIMDHLSPLFQGSEFGVQVPPEILRPINERR